LFIRPFPRLWLTFFKGASKVPLIRVLLFWDGSSTIKQSLHKSGFMFWKNQRGYVAVKVDMRQAYDQIEWVFIEETLKKLGFYSTFIGWIMECVKMPTFSNMFKPPKSLKSSRGRDFGRVTHFPLYFMFLVWMYSQDICWNWPQEIQSEVLK